jgi:hypothetical protein
MRLAACQAFMAALMLCSGCILDDDFREDDDGGARCE